MPRFLTDSVVIKSQNDSPQVLALGLPRCATSSLQTALESRHIELEPCMHMAHVIPHVNRGKVLLEAMHEEDDTRRHELLHILFDGYRASTDFPGSMFADDLMDMYPNSKIILNKRPGGGSTWAASIKLLSWAEKTSFYVICFLWPTDRNLHYIWHSYYKRTIRTLGISEDELLTEKHYDAHNAWVRIEAAKRGREVLEFVPKDGWAPLCELLGKATPQDELFPHENDAAQIRMIMRILYARGVVSWLILGGVVIGLVRLFLQGHIF